MALCRRTLGATGERPALGSHRRGGDSALMLRRSVHAATLLGFAAALSAQSGRTMTLTAPPRLGTTMVITVNHPANAAGNYFEALFSLPTPVELDLGLPFVVGLFRLDLSAFQTFVNGMFDSGTSTTLSIPVPNATNLIGGAFDLQTIDVDLSGPTLYLADNDLELRPFAGIGKVQLIASHGQHAQICPGSGLPGGMLGDKEKLLLGMPILTHLQGSKPRVESAHRFRVRFGSR